MMSALTISPPSCISISEHLDTEAVKHDKLLVVVLMEKSPFGDKGIIEGVQPLTYGSLFSLQIPFLS